MNQRVALDRAGEDAFPRRDFVFFAVLWGLGAVFLVLGEGAFPPLYIPTVLFWIASLGLFAVVKKVSLNLWYALPLVLLSLVSLASLPSAAVFGAARTHAVVWFAWVFYFFLIASFPQDQLFRLLGRAMIGLALFEAFLVLWQRSVLPNPYFEGQLGTSKNPNLLAECLAIGLFFFLSGALEKGRTFGRRSLFWAGSFLVGTALFLTASEATAGAFVGGLFVIALLRLWPRAFVLFVVGVIVLGLLLPLFFGALPTGDTDRLMMWHSTINMIRSHPLLGIGPGLYNFQSLFSFYKPPGYVGWGHAHSLYWMVGAESGLLGLGLFAAFLILLSSRAEMRGTKNRLLGGILFALLLHGLVDYTHWAQSSAFFFWTTAGLLAGSVQKREEGRVFLRLQRGAVAGVSLGLVLIGGWFGMVSTAMNRAETADASLRAYERLSFAASLDPSHPTVWRRRGLLMMRAGGFAAAREDFRRAVAADPFDSLTYLYLAVCDETLGNEEETFRDLHRAVQVDPYPADGKSHETLADFASKRGRDSLARYHAFMKEACDILSERE